MMQGYVNENYEAIISVAVKNGGSFKADVKIATAVGDIQHRSIG
jgi:hypothetical protein